MKIIIYTITDCAFSKQEKEYLTSHKLAYEEKNLETNREFLTEMLTVSNNFAGTPVTKIEKDDGQIVVLKGFTSQEFDKTLGFAEKKTETPPVTVVPAQEPVTANPTAQPTTPTPQTTTAPAPQDPMSNVLNNLAQKAEPSAPAPATVPPPVPLQPAMPNIPDPKL